MELIFCFERAVPLFTIFLIDRAVCREGFIYIAMCRHANPTAYLQKIEKTYKKGTLHDIISEILR